MSILDYDQLIRYSPPLYREFIREFHTIKRKDGPSEVNFFIAAPNKTSYFGVIIISEDPTPGPWYRKWTKFPTGNYGLVACSEIDFRNLLLHETILPV